MAKKRNRRRLVKTGTPGWAIPLVRLAWMLLPLLGLVRRVAYRLEKCIRSKMGDES